MSILISGDFHNNDDRELSLINKNALIQKYQQEKYDEIKYHIILGDAGFLWPGSERYESINYYSLSFRPFPILCVIGNHDPVLGRKDLKEIDIGIGEKVIVVRKKDPFIAYLKRGKVYNIENKKFLVLGGALSIDKEFRIPGRSWWEEEYWSEKEKKDVLFMLKKENHFDYVLAHTGPSRINERIKSPNRAIKFPMIFDKVAALNEKIDSKITCKQWFCGHLHVDNYYYCQNLNRGYQYLYRKTALMMDEEILI